MATPSSRKPYEDWNNPDKARLEIIRLRRRLYTAEQKCTKVMKELEAAREALGYYKIPFRFLELPREIRDKIYCYALLAPIEVRPPPLPTFMDMPLYKPPTPGLCLLSHQLYAEANEILYTKNTFVFDEPQQIMDFLRDIEATNRSLIRSISICVFFHNPLPQFQYLGTETSYWANALTNCNLDGVISMHVKADSIDGEFAPVSVDFALEDAIKYILLRDKEGGATRRLRFTGFSSVEQKKFPENWKISTEPWVSEEMWDEGEWDEELCNLQP
ncbi:MAG: hypothetical protein M1813_001749 [Trichoglossum hirsutum]|nr:MAG: hypothetical protein M1813_001749 [Trichoglossum hirsutum]